MRRLNRPVTEYLTMTEDEPLQQALRRAALRLITASRGRSEVLDRSLDTLRQTLRDDQATPEAIDAAVRTLESGLLALDDTEEADAAAELDAGDVPTAQNGERAQADTRTPPRSGSVWQRWFGKAGAPNNNAAAADTSLERFRPPLDTMTTRLNLPAPYQERLDELRRILAEADTVEELAGCLNRLADVLVKANERETAELEAFLVQLSRRLADLHAVLRADDGEALEADADEQRLDQAVQERVHSIQNALRDTGDPRQAHRIISADLDSLVQEVTSYRQSQGSRRQQARERHQALNAQLEATEQETLRLREALLEEQTRAELDALTGIANRAAFDRRIQEEATRSARYGSPMSLLVVDIDGFKPVNDRHGHATGDVVLTQVAELLQGQVRQADFVARYGGEEFALILPETARSAANRVAEKLRSAVAAAQYGHGEAQVPVTVSVGVAELGQGEAWQSLFTRADRALYQAKGDGRNRVVSGD